MSHNIEYRDYSEKTDKKKIYADINQYVQQATWREGGHGLDKDIRYIDKIMPDYDSAYQFLQDNDRGWYDCLAVKYREIPRGKSTKKIEELRVKCQEAWQEYDAANR
jgi:hypothetical protein